MRINRDNYEIWFIDFLDGSLSPDKKDELNAFLILNPDLADELALLGDASLDVNESVRFEGKESLKKQIEPIGEIDQDNYEEYLAAEKEGFLEPDEKKQLNHFFEANPGLAKERDWMAKTSLEADPAIQYEGKQALNRNIIPIAGIDEHNYDEFLAAEKEGLLKAEELERLNRFMQANPNLAKEREWMAKTTLEADPNLQLEDKEALTYTIVPISGIDGDNYDEWLVREFEGDLSASELTSLEKFLAKNPKLQQEQAWMAQTRLVADQNQVYPNKAELKRRAVVPLFRRPAVWMAAAASLALLFWLNVNDNPGYEPQNGGLAESGKTLKQSSQKRQEDRQAPQIEWQQEEDEQTALASTGDAVQESTEDPTSTASQAPAQSKRANAAPALQPQSTPANNAPREAVADAPVPPSKSDEPTDQRDPMKKLELVVPELNHERENVAVAQQPVQAPNTASASDSASLNLQFEETEEEAIAMADETAPKPQKGNGRSYTLGQTLVRGFKKRVLKSEDKKEELVSLDEGDAVAAGSSSVNKVLGTDIRIEKIKDENGQLMAWAFHSKALQFKRSVRK